MYQSPPPVNPRHSSCRTMLYAFDLLLYLFAFSVGKIFLELGLNLSELAVNGISAASLVIWVGLVYLVYRQHRAAK